MADLKILRVITRLNVGGPSLQAIDLSCAHEGWNTRLLSGQLPDGEKGLHSYMEGKDIDHHNLKHMTHPISPLKDFLALIEMIIAIREFKPDVIHSHHAKAGMISRVAAFFCRVPVVIHTFHGNVFQGHYSPLKSKMILYMEKFLSVFADQLIAISETQQRDLTEKFRIADKDKIPVLPLGFHLSRFLNYELSQHQARQKCQLPEEPALVGIVGRLTHVKNHDFFLEAFKEFSDHWHCVIIGDGELEDSLKKKVDRLPMKDRIHFHPTQSSIEDSYAALDVLAITSHSEGTPVTMIEAMAQGCSVVAAHVGGIPDVAGQGSRALLYEPGDHSAFVKACQDSYENKDLEKLSSAKQHIIDHHLFSKLQGSLNDLYQKMFQR